MSTATIPAIFTEKYKVVELPDNTEWKADPFPFYCLIGALKSKGQPVIIDESPILNVAIMNSDDSPVMSYRGTPRALYKVLASLPFACDHMIYIGYEIGRAECCALNNTPYVQS